jgi:hypothetical protein
MIKYLSPFHEKKIYTPDIRGKKNRKAPLCIPQTDAK